MLSSFGEVLDFEHNFVAARGRPPAAVLPNLSQMLAFVWTKHTFPTDPTTIPTGLPQTYKPLVKSFRDYLGA